MRVGAPPFQIYLFIMTTLSQIYGGGPWPPPDLPSGVVVHLERFLITFTDYHLEGFSAPSLKSGF